ncbi:Por secretion system C-terminal sorting domain-containing protein [Aquimarina amphilecti]|uniref:Por secretion system C-terminal sorting domain-containing protein n=1 Tax=Aquimarina amphilecti TaxID=1038014 RepID=A0A1H7VFF1_AQUAM|nr:discoidin domain-containing protein [Aquimarina amphilecti]SEM07973.1 Por secretion system C-terminal sorting domain-containing protein [Aquimarina amphilecti]
MKRIFTFLIIYMVTTPFIAQELYEILQEENLKVSKLERLGNKYYKNKDKGKGSGYKLYMRNLYWAKRNADANGRIISDATVVDERKKFQASIPDNNSLHKQNNERNIGWQELGPFKWTRTSSWTPGLGRITAIAVEPNQQNLMYAGSPGGGIWKSVNAGKKWIPLGDQMYNMSIWSIAIDPNNTNIVYLGNSAGQIMRSTNGGNSWKEIYRVSGTPRRILIHPNSNRIFIGTTKALYRSTNNGSSFSVVLNSSAEDVEFKPGNTSIVYACGNSFYRSNNGGSSFNRITNGINRSERMKMAVTPANPNAIYLVQKNRSSFGTLYRSLDGGSSFTIRATSSSTNQVYFTQASRDMAIAVSDSNSNEVHLGGMNYSRSLDGGITFSTLATWSNPGDRSYVHADIEVMTYIDGNIYVGSDGGIFRSKDRGNNMDDLTQGGLAVRQLYRFGGSLTDANMIVAGAQDNGTSIMNGSTRQFKEWLGADGMECFIDHKNKNVVYGTVQFGSLYKSTNGGNSIGNISKPGNFSGEWVTPFTIDPVDNKKIYVGYSNLFRSNNGGSNGSWRNITSSINIGGNLDEISIAASNNNYIYIAESGRVWRTKNGQNNNPSWTEISNFRGNVNFITVDPNNPERVAIAATGSRIYVSNNAGNSWTNVRGNLPQISAQCLIFDDTNANGLYVGMQSGVYYINDNLSSWVPFSTNLPGVQTTELEIHYPTRKIRVSTYGRGIWESDLYNEGTNPNDIIPPNDLSAQSEQNEVSLKWNDNSNNENGFTIQRNDGNGFERIDFVESNITTYTDQNLTNGIYTYRVRAYDTDSYSGFSNTVEAIIGDVDPNEITPPSDLKIQLDQNDIILTWKDNSNNENGFTIQRNDGSGFERIDFVRTGIETYKDQNLQTGTYTYRVRAYDSDSYSEFSNSTEITINEDVIDDCNGCIVYDTNSEETTNANHAKEKAADGDPNTYWHSNWYDDNTSHPHFIAIDLGVSRNLVGFSYQGRQTGTTGMVKDYILFGWDGNAWIQLSAGAFQKSTLKQTVEFDAFNCRYLYFRALSEVDDKQWASVAEFTVRYNTSEQIDIMPTIQNTDITPPLVDLTDFDGIKVFPIPFTDKITIDGIISKKTARSIQLIGSNGAVQKTKVSINGKQATIDTQKLAKGLYILKVQKDGVQKNIKILKQ